MIKQLYTIKDTISGEMIMPFADINDKTMLRGAKLMVNMKTPNYLNENIKDKQIWKLGTFNNLTGETTSEIKFITNMVDLVDIKKVEKTNLIEKGTENE